MIDEDKTRKEFINELIKLRKENSELKSAEKVPNRNSTLAETTTSYNNDFHKVYDYIKSHVSELINIPLLQQIFETFYELTGITHVFLDADAKLLTQTDWSDLCLNFHRKCPQTAYRCQQSDQFPFSHLDESPYLKYQCINGLMEYAAPIIVEGQHMGTIYLGQLFNEPPDEGYFRKQAQKYGFNEAAYLCALHKIKIIPEHQIEPIMKFYSKLGHALAVMGLERQRRIEAADHIVRKQEERLSLILEGSANGFWDWNIETGKIYRSPRWAEIWGYPPENIEPNLLAWEKHVHPDDLQTTLKTIKENLKGNIPNYETEYRLLTSSGEWKWILERGRVVARDKQGRPLRAAGTCLDITEHKKAEAALIQSEAKFSKAFHCNADPMSITTLKEGRYVEVNNAFIKLTGYEEDELIGYTAQELGIWDVYEQRDITVYKAGVCGSVQNIEANFRTKSGEIRAGLISLDIIDIDDEAHVLVAVRDITERKQMEELLRLSEECLSKAFDVNTILMSITTLEDGKYIKANKALCRALGYRSEQIIGRTSLELDIWYDPADRCLVKQKLIANQSIRDMEIIFKKSNGEKLLGLYSAERIDIHGEPCIMSTVTDITDLRRMEVEMTRLDRLNLVGEMAASIGHEIRNPMTTVRGYLQLLQQNEIYYNERDHFDLMIEELDRANSIVTEFLSLAKNKVVELEPTNLNAIITKLLPLVQAEALSRDQQIRLELDDLPDLLLDHKEITQLILNLIKNGMESMASSGYILVRTFIEKAKVILAVQDQGHGIRSEFLDKLGTPFFTTKEHGTGLGLAVCYRIANRHNANIDVKTGSNGTTFYIKFPIQVLA